MPGNCKSGAYGCEHHAEHVIAGTKSWRTRRASQLYRDELGNFEAAYGHVEMLHSDPNHKELVMFRQNGSWYRIPKKDYRLFARAGMSIRREQAREQARADREAERERKRGEKAAAIEARRQERYRKAEARYQEQMQREAERMAIREYHDLKRDLRKRGISPSKHTHYYRTRGKELPVDYGEWETLPRELRRRSGGYSLDEARELAEERASLGITGAGSVGTNSFDTIRDFTDYLERMERYARDVRSRRAKKAA